MDKLRKLIQSILEEGYYTTWNSLEENIDGFEGQEEEIVQKLAKHFDIKKRAPLGSGTNGFAYYIPNNKVLKVTKDKSEVAEAHKIQGKKLKHLANVYGAYTLGGKYDGTYVIISELLGRTEDIDAADDMLAEFFDKEFGYELNYLWEDYSNDNISKDEIKDYIKRIKKHFQPSDAELVVWYLIGKFGIIDDIKTNGILSMDWNTTNLGIKKDGNLAMYDLGHGDINVPPSVQNIDLNENPEVIRKRSGYETKDRTAYADVVKSKDVWHIAMIESSKPGNGTKLVNRIIEDAKKAGAKKITLTTTEFSGWGFFDKLGFKEVGENNDPHDIPMELILTNSSSINESVLINAKNFAALTDDELEQIAKWGLQNEFGLSGCWDDTDDLEIAVRCAMDDFKTFMKTPYPQGFKEFPSEPIVYRFITAPNKESIKIDNLGESWFADVNHYKNNIGFFTQLAHLKKDKPKDHILFLVSARVPISKIDIVRTLWKRSANWEENEIVLKDDGNLKVIEIKDMSKGPKEPINETLGSPEYPAFTDGQFNPLFKNRPSPPVMNMNSAPLAEINGKPNLSANTVKYLLNKMKIFNPKYLGSGASGDAYEADDKVIKFTKDIKEASLSQKLAGKKFAHIADIYKVTRYEEKPGDWVYIIIMEKLKHFNDTDRMIYFNYEKVFGAYEEFVGTTGEDMSFEDALKQADAPYFDDYFESWKRRHIKENMAQFIKINKQVEEAKNEIQKVMPNDIVYGNLDDLHSGNIGLKPNGNLAFFDMRWHGFSEHPKTMKSIKEAEISQDELNKKDLPIRYSDMFDDFILAKSEAEIREIAPTINLKQNHIALAADMKKNYPSLYDNFAEWLYEKLKGRTTLK